MVTSDKLLEVIRERRSIRKFKNIMIDEEVIPRLIEASIWAPSSCNRQPLQFIVVSDKEGKKVLANSVGGQRNILDAPTVIIVCVNKLKYPKILKNNIAPFLDAGVAIQNLLLMAHSLGLGACIVAGKVKGKLVREYFVIPEHYKVIGLILIGFPDEEPSPPQRQPVDFFYCLNKFEPQKIGLYSQVLKKRRQISRLGGDVSRVYKIPSEGIDLFGYMKEKVSLLVKNYENILLTYSGMGYFLEGLESKIDCLVSSEDEKWFIRQFKNSNSNLIISNMVEANLNIEKEYNCIVSMLDIHFMEKNEFDKFLENATELLKGDGTLVIIFFNKFSFYGLNYKIAGLLNRLNKHSYESIRNFGHEDPKSPKKVIQQISGGKLSTDKIQTGLFVPPLNIGYLIGDTFLAFYRWFKRHIPTSYERISKKEGGRFSGGEQKEMLPILPYGVCKKVDFFQKIPLLRGLGNVGFLFLTKQS